MKCAHRAALVAAVVMTAVTVPGFAEEVQLFLAFIPNVQFAPVYAAIDRGYFAEEGIEVTPEHSFNEADGVDRLALGDLRFGVISGEQVIVARGAGKPLVYVYEWYHDFPVAIAVQRGDGAPHPRDLIGKRVGVPGPFGASYMGLMGLLGAANVAQRDLTIESIGFTAPESLCQGVVDAAVVYVSNEPIAIEENCFAVDLIRISDWTNLMSNGLVTNERTIRDRPELVRGMVRALDRGIRWVIEHPEEAFDLSVRRYIRELPAERYPTERQVLANSVELWRSPAPGRSQPVRWRETHDTMLAIGFLRRPLTDLEQAYRNDFLP